MLGLQGSLGGAGSLDHAVLAHLPPRGEALARLTGVTPTGHALAGAPPPPPRAIAGSQVHVVKRAHTELGGACVKRPLLPGNRRVFAYTPPCNAPQNTKFRLQSNHKPGFLNCYRKALPFSKLCLLNPQFPAPAGLRPQKQHFLVPGYKAPTGEQAPGCAL